MEMGVYNFFSVFLEVIKYIVFFFLLMHMFLVPMIGLVHMLIFVWPVLNTKWKYVLLLLTKIIYFILVTSLIFYSVGLLNRGLFYIDKIYIILSVIPYFTMGILGFKYS